jgi:polysaccharide biosynthesis/export protein
MSHKISLLLPFLLIGCQAPQASLERPQVPVATAPRSTVVPRASYRVKVGDQLDIFVLEDKSFNGSFPVRETGEIILPQLGRVYVLGLQLPEVEAAVKRQLEGSQLKVATVIADPTSSAALSGPHQPVGMSVRVSGRVTTPGRVTVPQLGNAPVTAFQAITEAGGLLPFADKKHAYLLRSNGLNVNRIPVNLDHIEKGVEPDVPLQEGDTVIVPQKTLGF